MNFSQLNTKCQHRLSMLIENQGYILNKLDEAYIEEFSEIMEKIENLTQEPEMRRDTIEQFREQLKKLKPFVDSVNPDFIRANKGLKSSFGNLAYLDMVLNSALRDMIRADDADIPDFLLHENNALMGDQVDSQPLGTEIYIPDRLFQPEGEIGNGDIDMDEVKAQPLFPSGGPKVGDVVQKEDNACFLLANLVGIANRNPDAIRKLISDNNDGTVTVHLNALRHEKKVPLNIRIDKTVSNLDAESARWVKYIEKAVAASHVLQVEGSYPEGLRSAVESGKLDKFSVKGNLDGGMPEMAINMLTREVLKDGDAVRNEMMMSPTFEGAKTVLIEKMSRALAHGGNVFMYSGKHVVSINKVSGEDGYNMVGIYDQKSYMNRDGRTTNVALEDIISGAVKADGKPYEKIQINDPDFNEGVLKTDSIYLDGLETQYNKFVRPAKEEPKVEQVEQPQIEPDDNQINNGMPLPPMEEPKEEQREEAPRQKLVMDDDDDERQEINQKEEPEAQPERQPEPQPGNQLQAEFIVERIVRLNKEMQATARLTPKTSRDMMQKMDALSRFARENRNNPEVIQSIFDSAAFIQFQNAANEYMERWDASSKEGHVLNARQLAKIKICDKLAGLGNAVYKGKTLAQYKNYMVAEKLMIQTAIQKYQSAPQEGLGAMLHFKKLNAATEELMVSPIYTGFMAKAKINPEVDMKKMDVLIKTPSETLFKAVNPPKADIAPKQAHDDAPVL